MKNKDDTKNILIAFSIIIAIVFFIFVADISPDQETTLFVVHKDEAVTDVLTDKLFAQSFISSKWLFRSIYSISGVDIQPGGYLIKKGSSLFNMVQAFSKKPDLIWVTVPEGRRKEEIANILSQEFDWDKEDKLSFIHAHDSGPYQEGVYFPDTYLVPWNIGGGKMAQRMIDKFNEKLEPYTEEFINENIKWTTGLKLASIIQREAASEEEMDLIAGILWNRLLDGMKLQTDATLQYMTGKQDENWWKPISVKDKEIDSRYNTYMYKGVPPTPISNPGLAAIKAVLNPRETDCIYYIHSQRQIYCSTNYDDHMDKINKYLK